VSVPSPRATTDPVAKRARDASRRFARGTQPGLDDEPGPWSLEPGDGSWHEPWTARWSRRLLTFPGLWLLTALTCALLPLALAISIPYDLIRRRRLLSTRFILVMWSVVAWHNVGLAAMFLWWIGGLRWLGLKPRRWVQWNRLIEGWWGDKIIAIPEVFYGMRVEVEGDESLLPGPVLIFSRHASVIDTMLPLRILERWHQMVARIVKKRELLMDPCVDGISQRMPRTFVRRGSSDPEREIALLQRLTGGMGAYDGLWIYPEGTRFTHAKRAQILGKLGVRDPAAAARAAELTHTLPPRPAGTRTLLSHCRGMDVVFCAHTGLEAANRLENLLNGSLYRRVVRIKFWRVPASEVPIDPDLQLEWMHHQWKKVDRWVAENQDLEITELLAGE
jgi:1-acyl-sn-glycerol-3-phosphate acyltransferase